MDHAGMIIAGYAIVFATVLGYGAAIVARGRRLARELGLAEGEEPQSGQSREDP
ncbi:MAG: hypothetical protein GY708_15820 [Actinomycetia bacterium]|nr:hypothetical protein [Actinomycetes bacterium]MCP4960731.1 hypothetical protein [Actinomycetes bacterium]